MNLTELEHQKELWIEEQNRNYFETIQISGQILEEIKFRIFLMKFKKLNITKEKFVAISIFILMVILLLFD